MNSKFVKVVDVFEQKFDFPVKDEAYTVGMTEDGRYFFSWGPHFPKEGPGGMM